MGRITTFLFVILIIISGCYTIPTCYSFLKTRSDLRGTSSGPVIVQENQDEKAYYIIDYELDGGGVQVANPIKYNLFTEDFILNNPIRDGYEFLGWTWSINGSNQTEEPIENLTIKQGSCGDITFYANWLLVLGTPELSFGNSYGCITVYWTAIQGATGYQLNVNGTNVNLAENISNCVIDESLMIVGNNNVKVRAVGTYKNEEYFGSWSNILQFNVESKLADPELTINGSTISWTDIEGCNGFYSLLIGNDELLISKNDYELSNGICTLNLLDNETTINVSILSTLYASENVVYFSSTSHSVPIQIRAVSAISLTAPGLSNNVHYYYQEWDLAKNAMILATTVTKSSLADNATYDNTSDSNLCIWLRSEFIEKLSEEWSLGRESVSIEIYKDNNLIGSDVGYSYTPWGLYHLKVEGLISGTTYSAVINIQNLYHSGYILKLNVSFVYNTNSNNITYISVS